jgi:hypothetical protein
VKAEAGSIYRSCGCAKNNPNWHMEDPAGRANKLPEPFAPPVLARNGCATSAAERAAWPFDWLESASFGDLFVHV